MTKIDFKKKIINFFSNKTVLACLILTAIYLISGYVKAFEYVFIATACLFFIILPIKEAFAVFAYLHCYSLSNLSYGAAITTIIICFFAIMLVKYIIGLKQGKYPIYKTLLIAICCFVLVSVLLSLPHKVFGEGFIYLIFLPLIYLFVAMRNEFDINKAMQYMAVGLIVSCLLALVMFKLPHFNYMVIFEDVQKRFQGFSNHPNYLYFRAILVITYFMYAYLAKKISLLTFVLVYLPSTLIVFATLSKTGIVMWLLFTIVFVVLFLKQDFKTNIKWVGILVAVCLIALLIGHSFVKSIIDRFTTNNGNIINSILTDRDNIWKDYFKAIFSNAFVFLFGYGILTKEVFIVAQGMPRASHNLYIFLLYRFGLVGCIALGYIIYLIVKICLKDKSKPKLIAYIPIAFMLLESLCDNTFKPYNFTAFIFAFMILFEGCKTLTEKTLKTNEVNETNPTEQTTSMQESTSKLKTKSENKPKITQNRNQTKQKTTKKQNKIKNTE